MIIHVTKLINALNPTLATQFTVNSIYGIMPGVMKKNAEFS